jgi:hypothetical protein
VHYRQRFKVYSALVKRQTLEHYKLIPFNPIFRSLSEIIDICTVSTLQENLLYILTGARARAVTMAIRKSNNHGGKVMYRKSPN